MVSSIMHETGMPLNPPSARLVKTHVTLLHGGSKTQITVLACTSATATGYTIPPFVIFDCQTLNPREKFQESHMAYLQMVGLTARKLFCDWVFEHFLACMHMLHLLDHYVFYFSWMGTIPTTALKL